MNISYIGKFTAFVCAAILASCATNPASIRPEPYVVGVERIASLPCWHISKSLNELESELSTYYETQRNLVEQDAMSVVSVIAITLLFPPLSCRHAVV